MFPPFFFHGSCSQAYILLGADHEHELECELKGRLGDFSPTGAGHAAASACCMGGFFTVIQKTGPVFQSPGKEESMFDPDAGLGGCNVFRYVFHATDDFRILHDFV